MLFVFVINKWMCNKLDTIPQIPLNLWAEKSENFYCSPINMVWRQFYVLLRNFYLKNFHFIYKMVLIYTTLSCVLFCIVFFRNENMPVNSLIKRFSFFVSLLKEYFSIYFMSCVVPGRNVIFRYCNKVTTVTFFKW